MPLRQSLVLATATVALLAAALLSLALGSTTIAVADIIDVLPVIGHGDVNDPIYQIVNELRIPRAVTAVVVGASLAVAGSLLQGALGNPLASPDIIGVTAGAGFGAMLLLLAVPDSVTLVPISALVFGLAAAALVFSVAWAGRGGGGVARLVLAGIAVSAIFTAGTTMLMAAYPDRVSSAVYFIAGYLPYDGWSTLSQVWPYVAVGAIMAVLLIRPLDRLALGDDVAQSLGARPRMIRLQAAVAAALLAAAAAAMAGLLGFLGLVVPHVVRLAGGTSSHRFVVPASAIAGAALLLLADTFARRIAAPLDLPVGPFLVVLGVPLFLWLLRKAI